VAREAGLRLLVPVTSCVCLAAAVTASASTLPAGFRETTVFEGLVSPTAVKFAADGRVFVAEKSGIIKVYASLLATTPAVFADLRPQVFDYWDRGLLGLELDPAFPTRPYVYVLYTLDRNPADPVATVPTWRDACPSPPGPTASGCPALGRLSRLNASTPWPVQASEQILLESFPQQFPSHSVGGLAFGADGALYVTTGEGASFTAVDYGQFGGQDGAGPGQRVPSNPLGDPPAGTGGLQIPPGAEGGALRSQSVRRSPGEPAALSGALLRLDPDTGAALPDNPLFGRADPQARRIVAYGFRNPLRFTFRPGTREVWVGDVGWNKTEEINRLDLNDHAAENYGWPCYEGSSPQSGYQAAGLSLCQALYADGTARSPFFEYDHSSRVVPGESCPTGTAAISGLAFYTAQGYPGPFQGALFFADWARRCMWAVLPDAAGLPDPARVVTFAAGMDGGAVALEPGPGGDLFYVDFDLGRIQRLSYDAGNRPPVARATATPTSGTAPLFVQFDASASTDPEGGPLEYEWDFDHDGSVDSTAVSPTHTFTASGPQLVRLEVEDTEGARSTAWITVYSDNRPPQASLSAPLATLTWKVGDTVAFAGVATDPDEGTLPTSAMTWTLFVHHCPAQCHVHTLQQWNGVRAGSFATPDHEYPSWLELQLKATDAGGLSDTISVTLLPQTVSLTFETDPPGLFLALASESLTTPFTRTVIVGSRNSVAAPSPQPVAGVPYGFRSWSDGGAASHLVVAPDAPSTLRATYRPFADLFVTASGSAALEGGRFTLTAEVGNRGPATATEALLEVGLPTGWTLVSSQPPGACAPESALRCSLPQLAPGERSSLAVILRPARAGPLDLGLVASCAEAEPNGADNVASVHVSVRPWSDLSGDGKPDLVWQSSLSGVAGAWLMNGTQASGMAAFAPSRGPDPRWQLGGLGDFDGDGRPDLFWRNPASGTNEIWLMDGLTQRSVAALPPVGDAEWMAAGAGDFNGDGWPDILWRHRTSGSNRLTFMNGVVPAGGAALPAISGAWEVLGVADVNDDGKPDVLWRRQSDGLNAAWLMNGATVASTASLPTPADAGWRIQALVDLNGDGKTDLVFRHQTTGADAVVFLSGLQATGSAPLPAVPDLSWKLVGPR
jgi:glucose/arabinose dehydrogenase